MRPLVLLFDIDGTLIASGGAGRRAIESAFAECHGRADACEHFSFAGMTDRAIAREGLRAIGERDTAHDIDALLACYIRHLEAAIKNGDGYHVHAGILPALAAAEVRAQCAIGLGTGNIRAGARAKLTPAALHHRFAFGGFGCDHEDRAALIGVGLARGAARLGLAPKDVRAVVIGDTPKDVAAAHANGAFALAVATGGISAEDLRACGADLVVADLSAPGAIEALLA
jgi:phosphoglycolate phosphatase-like HAD superfamily hydrolase